MYNDNIVKIQSIYVETLNTEEFTYNFEVEDYHTYYVSSCNVLVHNTCTKVTTKSGKVLYRGGDDLLENINDGEITIENGMVQPGGGPSLNTDINFAIKKSNGRGAYTLDKIPEGLGLKRSRHNKSHYVIQALKPMPEEEYIALLKTIKLTPA